jgi:hypothetical protein
MKLNKKLIKWPRELEGKDIEIRVVKNNMSRIQTYCKNTQQHLEALKQEVGAMIDEAYPTLQATGFDTVLALKDKKYNRLVNFADEPSVFLNQAYTLQTNKAENRVQAYIDAGTFLSQYCEDKSLEATTDILILNDIGNLICAINNALSQIYKIDNLLKQQQHEDAAELLPFLKGYIAEVEKAAKRLNPSRKFELTLQSLLNAFINFFAQFLNPKKEEKQAINKQQIERLKRQYDDFTQQKNNSINKGMK